MRNCNAAGIMPLVVKLIGIVTVEPGSDTPGDIPSVAP